MKIKLPIPTDEEYAEISKPHKETKTVDIPAALHNFLMSRLFTREYVSRAVSEHLVNELHRLLKCSKNNANALLRVPIEKRREYAAKAREVKMLNYRKRKGLEPHNASEKETIRVRACDEVYHAFMALHKSRKSRVYVASLRIDAVLDDQKLRAQAMSFAHVVESGDRFITIHKDTAARCAAVGRSENCTAAKIISACIHMAGTSGS